MSHYFGEVLTWFFFLFILKPKVYFCMLNASKENHWKGEHVRIWNPCVVRKFYSWSWVVWYQSIKHRIIKGRISWHWSQNCIISQCLVQIHNGMFDNIPSYIGKLQLINVFSRVFFCIIFKFYAEFSPASSQYMDLNIFGNPIQLLVTPPNK